MTPDTAAIDLAKSRTRWPWGVLFRRVAWTYVIEPLVRWLPKPCSPVRIVALRLFGARIGPRCLIMPGVKVLMPWKLVLADHVALGEGVNVYNFSPVQVGRMTLVSQRVFLCTGSHDYTHPHMPLTHASIWIGENCWIAAEAFIAPGVAIPDGVVVGARSVIGRSIADPWTVWAGNPARMIKRRQLRYGQD